MQNKRRRNKASKFIPNLHRILSDKDSGVFWREDAKSFVLTDISKLISNSLPKYFRHSNISSFIRQLNLYGFKKLVGDDIQQNTYYHDKFKKNYITQLKPIRSFYNQQKYGRLRKSKNTQMHQESISSIQSNEQQDQIIKTGNFSHHHSDFQLKQKIAILENQNQRLKQVEQEHFRLLNLLNSSQKGLTMHDQYQNHQSCNYGNFMQQMPKETPNVLMQTMQNYENNLLNQSEEQNPNFSFYQNVYYMPFQTTL